MCVDSVSVTAQNMDSGQPPIDPAPPRAFPLWLTRLLSGLAATIGLVWYFSARDGGAVRWGALAYALVIAVVTGLIGEALNAGRRLPKAPRAQIRGELRRLFSFGIPTVEAVYEVLEKDGDAGSFKREHDATDRFLRGMITEAEWGATMRRHLHLD